MINIMSRLREFMRILSCSDSSTLRIFLLVLSDVIPSPDRQNIAATPNSRFEQNESHSRLEHCVHGGWVCLLTLGDHRLLSSSNAWSVQGWGRLVVSIFFTNLVRSTLQWKPNPVQFLQCILLVRISNDVNKLSRVRWRCSAVSWM
jgi:hypothetical protein